MIASWSDARKLVRHSSKTLLREGESTSSESSTSQSSKSKKLSKCESDDSASPLLGNTHQNRLKDTLKEHSGGTVVPIGSLWTNGASHHHQEENKETVDSRVLSPVSRINSYSSCDSINSAVPSSLNEHNCEETGQREKYEVTLWNDVCVMRDNCLSQPVLASLFLCLPIAMIGQSLQLPVAAIFVTNLLSIIPLAWQLGNLTEELALHTSPVIGGLCNAALGNATELIVAVAALRRGMIRLVQTSLLGSILSNMLLVLGTSFLLGGLRFQHQTFNRKGAAVFSSMLLLACLALAIPSAYVSSFTLEANESDILDISRVTAVILLVCYLVYLHFQLLTHTRLFDQLENEEADNSVEDAELPSMSISGVLIFLMTIAIAISVCSDALVDTIEPITQFYSINEKFVGLIILPVVGNASEHLTSVYVALKNKLDLSISVAVGSSTQIALFVIPLLTILGYFLDQEMTLNFGTFETISLVLSCMVAAFIIKDGQSNYLLGFLLVGSYFILATAFAFSPRPGDVTAIDDGLNLIQKAASPVMLFISSITD